MSSCDRFPRIETSHGLNVESLVFLAGWFALLVLAGCGGSTNTNGGPVSASVSGTIGVGTAPSAIAVDSTTNKIYVTDFGTIPTGIPCSQSGADIEVIDGGTQAKTSVGFDVLLQVSPTHAALNPVSHELYIVSASYWNGIYRNDPCAPTFPSLEFFDTTSLQPPNHWVFTDDGVGIDVNPITDTIYVTYPGVLGKVFVYDSNLGYQTEISVGSVPIGVAVNATSNKIYVADSRSNNISVVDGASNTLLATVADPKAITPAAVAVNATTNTIYVANFQSNNVTVINGATNSVIATIPVGISPAGLAVESQTNFIYVANSGTNDITVINGATNATTMLSDPNAKNPVAVAANSVTNKIYVANSGSNNVTVIDEAHAE